MIASIHSIKLQAQYRNMVDCIINGDSEGVRRIVNGHLALIRDIFVENGVISKGNEVAEIRTALSNP